MSKLVCISFLLSYCKTFFPYLLFLFHTIAFNRFYPPEIQTFQPISMCMHMRLFMYVLTCLSCIQIQEYLCIQLYVTVLVCYCRRVSVCTAHVSANRVQSNLSTSEVNHCQYEILICYSWILITLLKQLP